MVGRGGDCSGFACAWKSCFGAQSLIVGCWGAGEGLYLSKPSEKASLLKYGEVLWSFREHVWGEGTVPV